MSDAEIGFYIRCLNHAWINGWLPADPVQRARVLKTRLDTANKYWLRVGKCWVTSSLYPERLTNLRQEMERSSALHKSEMAAKSVNHRYERSTNESLRARALDSDTDTEVIPPISPTEEPKTNAPQAALSRSRKRDASQIGKALGPERIRWWLDFWSVFPCHDGKLPCMDAFERRIVSPEIWEACRGGAERYAEKARADPTMRLKYGQGWINDCRWEDEQLALVTHVGNGTNGRSKSFVDDVKSVIQRNLEKDGKPW